MSSYQIPRRNVTVTREQRNGCTVDRCIDHDNGDAVTWTLYGLGGWRVGDYKTERGLDRAVARVTEGN